MEIDSGINNLTQTSADTWNNNSVTNTRLGACEVCANVSAKYTCPRCEVKTCCLRCTKIHKQEMECDGTRDKTKFIPVKKFSNLDLSSDYRLLEEITRHVKTLQGCNRTRQPHPKKPIPHFLLKIHKAAASRKTTLKFLPQTFTRRKANTTHFNVRSDTLYWHVEWLFCNADNLKIAEDAVPDTDKLSTVLHKYFIKQEDKILQERLQFYQAVDLPGIKLLLKAEQKADTKYYELDPLASLKDNLKNKIIIEYPTIHVVLKEHSNLYNVLDSDDENEDMEVAVNKKVVNGTNVVEKIIKKAEKEESLDYSLKNLLFISELSEEDDLSDE